MSMKTSLRSICAALVLLSACVGARANLITIVGAHFDLTYDDTKLGLFGAPTLSGDSLFFSLNSFSVQSLNGAQLQSLNSTISSLVLTSKGGYQFGAFSLAELGDYLLTGANSAVSVAGQLRAFNTASANFTNTTASLNLNPLTPLTINDGVNHDWLAAARIDASTAPVPVLFGTATNVILSRPSQVSLTIENRLTAYTDPAATGLRQAFIEKKFTGVQLDVVPVAAVPLPPAAALLGTGLMGLSLLLRRRRAA